MRSVILLSVLLVCDAFGTGTTPAPEEVYKFFAYALLIFFVMDMIELGKRK